MKKQELLEYTKTSLSKPVKIYKYLESEISEKMKSSYSYKKTSYCPSCEEKIFLSFDETGNTVICPLCHKIIDVKRLSNRIKSTYNVRFIFGVLDYDKKENCILHTTYCKDFCYGFKSGVMTVIPSLFKIGCDTYDLNTFNKIHLTKNTYLPFMSYRRIANFGASAIVKVCSKSVFDINFSCSKYETLFFLRGLFFTNSFKEKFLKYLDIGSLKKDFSYSIDLCTFARALNVYPNLETIYKQEQYSWTDRKIDFFESVLDCLRTNKRYSKFNYELMKNIYINSYSGIDFLYYKVNLKLGKPYLVDFELIDFLSNKPAYITRKTVNYLEKQPFSLYQDYIFMCGRLGIDISKPKNLYPKNLKEAHDELSLILEKKERAIVLDFLDELKESYSLLEFEESGYCFSLPRNVLDFKTRGTILKQCLFAAHYDDRYLAKKDVILFIDSLEDNSLSNKFTLELDMKLKIVQLHGFANDVNASDIQLTNREKVLQIIQERLSLLEIKQGQILYKNRMPKLENLKKGVSL